MKKKQLPGLSELTKARINSDRKLTAQTSGKYAGATGTGTVFSPFLTNLNKSASLSIVDKAVIELLFLHGLRISEVLSINYSDVLHDGRIIIHGSKGSQNRLIHSVLFSSFWADGSTGLLPLNSIYSRFYFSRLFKKLGYYKKFGQNQKNSVTHYFRHVFVQELLAQGVPESDISLFIGHNSKRSIRYYVDN